MKCKADDPFPYWASLRESSQVFFSSSSKHPEIYIFFYILKIFFAVCTLSQGLKISPLLSRSMWCSTWSPGRTSHQIHVHRILHVQSLLRSVVRQTTGTKPRLYTRRLDRQVQQPKAVAANWLGNSCSSKENRHPGPLWRQSVGEELHSVIQS